MLTSFDIFQHEKLYFCSHIAESANIAKNLDQNPQRYWATLGLPRAFPYDIFRIKYTRWRSILHLLSNKLKEIVGSDIINLMRNDPNRYLELSDEITKAYAEKRVR